MEDAPVVTIRLIPGADRVEVSLHPGFARKDLDVVRALPGRRYDSERRIWMVPNASAAIEALTRTFGTEGVLTLPDSEPSDPASGERGEEILGRVEDALTVRGYSHRTRKVYLGHLRRFLTWCGGGDPQLPEDPVREIQAYLLELVRARIISRSYQNQLVSALRFMCESVLGEPRLALRIPRPRKEQRLPAVLSKEEVARLLRMPRNAKHRAILILLYSAGLRVGEVVRLRPEDVDMERNLLLVRRGKGGKDRYTILARRAAEALVLYRDAYPTDRWLFPGNRRGRHLTTRSVQRVVKANAAAAGIKKHVTAHTLRHSFATHLLENGTNLRIIQELLGHQNARTTQIYTHVAQSTIESIRSPLDQIE